MERMTHMGYIDALSTISNIWILLWFKQHCLRHNFNTFKTNIDTSIPMKNCYQYRSLRQPNILQYIVTIVPDKDYQSSFRKC